jgi:hypothetical protein
MGRNIPISEIKGTQLVAKMVSKKLKGKTPEVTLDLNTNLVVEYFNSGIMAFEPLIETWTFSLFIKVRNTYTPLITCYTFSIFSMQQGANPKLAVSLSSSEWFKVNILFLESYCMNVIISVLTHQTYIASLSPTTVDD